MARRDNKISQNKQKNYGTIVSTGLGLASNYNGSPKEWKTEEKQFHAFFEELILELKELAEKSLFGYVA